MANRDEDITTFAGFESWMSTVMPYSSQQPAIHELPVYQGAVFELEADRPVELPAHHYAPGPIPIPAPTPAPTLVPNPPPVATIVNKLGVNQEPLFEEIPDPISTIEVHGLQKVCRKGIFTETLSISTYSFLSDISSKLQSLGEWHGTWGSIIHTQLLCRVQAPGRLHVRVQV